jgi:uncharacterized protein DUF5670
MYMLLAVAVVLGILWLLGLVVVHITSPILHLLLVVAVAVIIYDFMTKRKRI